MVDVIITIADYTAAVQYIARGGRWYRREIPFKQPLAEQLDDNGTAWHLSTSRSMLTEIRCATDMTLAGCPSFLP